MTIRYAAASMALAALCLTASGRFRAVPFTIARDIPLQAANPDFCWFHPRSAAIPKWGAGGMPLVVMTLNKHLDADDHYSGLWYMYTGDLGKSWKGPFEPPQLGAEQVSETLHAAVHDVTPGWHAATGRLLAIGGKTYYDSSGKHLSQQLVKGGTAYAVYDPKADAWTRWRMLELPDEPLFTNARNACAQWLVKPDGKLLVPVYCQKPGTPYDSVTVLECEFDGATLRYRRHGTVIEQNTKRGLAEPSIIHWGRNYYLTIRHDDRGYATVSRDGLDYAPIREWTFDDGAPLGSFNTQQHWLAHQDGLFLCYTSRRPENSHINRARAPLFIGQVDPEKLAVVRSTERTLIPERGLMLGNFGADAITPEESWVTDAEFLWYKIGLKPTAKGGNGSVWVARVTWGTPNRLAPKAGRK
jgi:hypothetical protein